MKLVEYFSGCSDFELKILVHHLEIESDYKILEVGCNETDMCNILHQLGCETWGIDVNKNERAKFRFIQSNFQDVQLFDNYFDVAIDISALHHFGIGHYGDRVDLDGDITAAKKIFRALKPGGLFYVSTDRIGKDYIPVALDSFRQYNLNEFTNRIINSAGFKVLKLELYFPDIYPPRKANIEIDGCDGKQLFALLQK
jgi:ubiquinone/menaquinone biosynthesis C-methylase UbiE